MKIIDVLITYPTEWDSFTPGLGNNLLRQTPKESGEWGNIKFHVNKNNVECEYWIVFGGINTTLKNRVKKNTIFITGEVANNIFHNDVFLNQFDYSITGQSEKNLNTFPHVECKYFTPWQINKSYDTLKGIKNLKKSKDLSAIISDLLISEGHKKRFAFINQLKGHFKEELDWYGRGNKFINDKWDGLKDYKYSIAIENSSVENYWTEKLADCLLSFCMPFYFGCPNMEDFFAKESMVIIDINNPYEAMLKIEEAIRNNLYEKNFDAIVHAREKLLDQYQMMPQISKIIFHLEEINVAQSRLIKLYPESKFKRIHFSKRIYSRILKELNIK